MIVDGKIVAPVGEGTYRTKTLDNEAAYGKGAFDIFVCDNCGQEGWTDRRDLMLTTGFIYEEGDDLRHQCVPEFEHGLYLAVVMSAIPPGLAWREMLFDHR